MSQPSVQPGTGDLWRDVCYTHPFFAQLYEGWELIGQGAFSRVVKVRSKHRGKDVALKIMTEFDQSKREKEMQRFQAEVVNAQKLASRYVVQLYAPYVFDNLAWIEMEFIDGVDLDHELERRAAANDPFGLNEALEIALCVAEALVDAHDQGIIHRDIKPANILLPGSAEPRAKLADFGISRSTGAARLTASGAFPGTPQFASPEAFHGQALDKPHDIYCLGMCLYLLFTNNRLPFPIEPDKIPVQAVAVKWLNEHLNTEPKRPRAHDPTLPESLDDLIVRCLIKKPAGDRPTARDVLGTLRELRGSGPAVAGNRRNGSRATLRAPALLGITAVAVALTFGLSRRTSTSHPESEVLPSAPSIAPQATAAIPSTAPRIPPPPLASPTTRATTAGTSVRAGPDLTAQVRGDAIRITNASNAPCSGLRVVFSGDGGTVHERRINSRIPPRTSIYVPLADFQPSPAAGATFREIRVECAGG